MKSTLKHRLHVVLDDSQKLRFEELYQKSEESLGTNEKNHSHREILQEWMNLFQEINFGKESLRLIRLVDTENNSFANDVATHECIFCGKVSWLFTPTPRGALCIECACAQAVLMVGLSKKFAKEYEKKHGGLHESFE